MPRLSAPLFFASVAASLLLSFVLLPSFSSELTLPSDSVAILVGQTIKPDANTVSVNVGDMSVAKASADTGLSALMLSQESKKQGGDGTKFSQNTFVQIPKSEFAKFALDQARRANAAGSGYCVPESVTVAQAMLESASGSSRVARDNNNFFGIKTYSGSSRCMKSSSVYCAYSSVTDSFLDHNSFFYKNGRYAQAIACRSDFSCFARKIAQAGYAEDPTYSSQLLSIISRNNLAGYNSCA